MDDLNITHVARLYTLLLLKRKPRHGYEIITEIGEITGSKPSTSHIYPFLQKLEEKDLIKADEQGERGKKVYRLTESGEAFVRKQIDSFGTILDAALEDRITDCAHCDCQIYDGGFQQDGKTYCCQHCAEADR